MKERIWPNVQLFLAFWLIPIGPMAVTLGAVHALDWPAWGIAILALTVTWPAAWYVWLLKGDDDAIRR